MIFLSQREYNELLDELNSAKSKAFNLEMNLKNTMEENDVLRSTIEELKEKIKELERTSNQSKEVLSC